MKGTRRLRRVSACSQTATSMPLILLEVSVKGTRWFFAGRDWLVQLKEAMLRMPLHATMCEWTLTLNRNMPNTLSRDYMVCCDNIGHVSVER